MKRFIRGVLSGVCFIIFGIGSTIIGFILLPVFFLITTDREKFRYISSAAIKYSWKFFLSLMCVVRLIKIKIVNMERIKEIKSSVIVANHPSLIDIIILVCLIPKPLCVVKSSLTDNIFMKNIVSSVYILNNTDIDIFISECTRALNSGYNIIIFPEGTRTIYGKSKKYHRGAAYIALKSNASVIPVHIDMSDHILGKDKKFYDVSDRPVLYTLTVKSPIIMSETVDKNLLDSANARNIMAKIQLLLSS